MYISAVIERGYLVRPSRVSPTPPASEFSIGTIAVAPPGRYARKDAVDGRLENNGFAPEPERELVGERPFGAERDDGHFFTMHSIRASVSSCPRSQ